MHTFWRIRLLNMVLSLHAPQNRDFCLRLWMKGRYMRVLRPAWFCLVSSRWNYVLYMRVVAVRTNSTCYFRPNLPWKLLRRSFLPRGAQPPPKLTEYKSEHSTTELI